MKFTFPYSLCLTTVLLLLASCKGGGAVTVLEGAANIDMKYASLLTMQQGDGFVLAQIRNPWDTTAVLHRYVLVPKDQDIPEHLPQGEVIRTPLSHALFYTSVHVSLIDELGAYDAIGGVCDQQYMYLERVRKDIESGKIVDCGMSQTPDIESIINLAPDAILLSPFESSGTYGKLGSIGIPIIECADYMETGALGRAEWMRFYGLLVGKADVADSLFATIESDYQRLKDMVKDIEYKPTVVCEKKFGSSWYVAGANSTIGRLVSDAGGDYIFSNEPAAGSVPYAPEVVFDRAQDADIWMLKYRQEVPLTYGQLAQEWSTYAEMKAFKTCNVYGCNLYKVAYYEETPFHPNVLLREYIKVFHPDVLKGEACAYFERLKE